MHMKKKIKNIYICVNYYIIIHTFLFTRWHLDSIKLFIRFACHERPRRTVPLWRDSSDSATCPSIWISPPCLLNAVSIYDWAGIICNVAGRYSFKNFCTCVWRGRHCCMDLCALPTSILQTAEYEAQLHLHIHYITL